MVNSPRLLDEVQDRIRARHMSLRTEKTYLHWITSLYPVSQADGIRAKWVARKSRNS